jgi:DNA transposition AAA+ family ATPase
MAAIPLAKGIYEQFSACAPDTLEDEISRTSIRLRLQEAPKTDEERRIYQLEADRLSGLKHLSQLRKGKLSQEDFNLKVKLVTS